MPGVVGATSTGAPGMHSQKSTDQAPLQINSEEPAPSFVSERSVAVSKLLIVCVCVSFMLLLYLREVDLNNFLFKSTCGD